MNHAINGSGKAYAFCQAGCSLGTLRGELNRLKAVPERHIPPEMRVFLRPLSGVRWGYLVASDSVDMLLVGMAHEWAMRGANYFVTAIAPSMTNEETAACVLGMIVATCAVKDVHLEVRRPAIDVCYRDDKRRFFLSKLYPSQTYREMEFHDSVKYSQYTLRPIRNWLARRDDRLYVPEPRLEVRAGNGTG